MFSNVDLDFCPFRITSDNCIEYGIKDPRELPGQGICTVSQTRKESCQFPGAMTNYCPRLESQDFCEMRWAINPSLET